MRLLITTMLAAVLLLPMSHVAIGQVAEESAPAASVEADVESVHQKSDQKQGFQAEIIDQMVTDLEGELDRPELTDKEREKINKVIAKLSKMETLTDLADLAEIAEIAELDIGDHAFKDHHNNGSGNFMQGLEGVLIPIFAIVFVFGSPVLIVALVMRNNARRTRMQHETINKFVESGQEIPADLFDTLQNKATPKSNLRKGLVLCGLGVGVGGWALVSGSINTAGFALIPICIGAALLLIWKLENKNEG